MNSCACQALVSAAELSFSPLSSAAGIRYVFDVYAAGKCLFADVCHAFGYCDLSQIIAALKCSAGNCFCFGIYLIFAGESSFCGDKTIDFTVSGTLIFTRSAQP